MVFLKLIFVGFLMVLWPKYILTFCCIFTFGALGLESPREGAMDKMTEQHIHSDFVNTGTHGPSAACATAATDCLTK